LALATAHQAAQGREAHNGDHDDISESPQRMKYIRQGLLYRKMLSILIYNTIIKISNNQQHQRQRQNPPNIPIFVDNTATGAGLTLDQNNRFVLQPIENNQQAQAIGRYNHNTVPPFAVQT
jgi:hypothetical protein